MLHSKFLYKLARPFLFLLPPEFSHKLVLFALFYLDKMGLIKNNYNNKNILGLAAGFDKNGEYISVLAKLGFDYIEVGTVTPRPQSGNPKPRLFRLPMFEALVNKMGFNNKGIDNLVKNIKKFRQENKNNKLKNYKIGVNIGKNFDTPIESIESIESIEDINYINPAIKDYLICLEKAYIYSDYIIINISSPNTLNLRKLQSAEYLEELLKSIKNKQLELYKAHNKYVPLGIKIAPDLTDEELFSICDLIVKYNIDILSATNTSIDYNVNNIDNYINKYNSKKSNNKYISGGLSGSPIKYKSNILLQKIVDYINTNYKDYTNNITNKKIYLIGIGGINSLQDAKDKLAIGADSIQIYTGFIYSGLYLIKNINQNIN